MSNTLEPGVRAEIDALYARYVDTLDDGDVEGWPELFTDDCTYRIISREGYRRAMPIGLMWCDGKKMLRDRVYAFTKLAIYAERAMRHLISVLTAEPAGEGYRVRANYAVFETRIDQESHVFSVGRYADILIRSGADLKFREKICVYDNEIVANSLVQPL